MYRTVRNLFTVIFFVFSLWIGLKLLLPALLPFLLGGSLALAAEPLVAAMSRRLKLPRPLAAGIGVTGAFLLFAMLVLLLCGFFLRELGILASMLPDLELAARSGMDSLSRWVLGVISRMPRSIRDVLTRNASEFFSGSSAMLDQAFRYALNLAGGFLKAVPSSAVVLGTGIISSFMISAKLPRLRIRLRQLLESPRLQTILEAFQTMKGALLGYLKAQMKLMGFTFCLLAAGFLLLRIPYGLLWAVLVSLVDAFPVLGTGTVLLPWSLICLLQQDTPRALGLLGIYTVITLTRSLLEPKLVGRQLGLDPLATLISLYAGYRFFGLAGMLLAPLITVAALELIAHKPATDS